MICFFLSSLTGIFSYFHFWTASITGTQNHWRYALNARRFLNGLVRCFHCVSSSLFICNFSRWSCQTCESVFVRTSKLHAFKSKEPVQLMHFFLQLIFPIYANETSMLINLHYKLTSFLEWKNEKRTNFSIWNNLPNFLPAPFLVANTCSFSFASRFKIRFRNASPRQRVRQFPPCCVSLPALSPLQLRGHRDETAASVPRHNWTSRRPALHGAWKDRPRWHRHQNG